MNKNATTWRIDFFLDPQGEAVVRIDEIRAYEKENYVGRFQVRIDLTGEIFPCRYPPVMPGLNDTLALKG
jgi:hypothetical protein